MDELKNSAVSFYNAKLPVALLFSKRIRQLREYHELSQQTVSELLSVSRAAYGYYENGKNNIRLDDLIRLARLYGVSTDYLWGLS